MDIEAAGRQLVEAGKSEALIAAFHAVAQSTGPDGARRHDPRAVRTLARLVSCRAYGRAVYELCHLVNIADAAMPGRARWERFVFAPPRASAAGFRAQVEAALAARGWRRDGFRREADTLVAELGGKPFAVSFARMPVLAALLEFLVATVGYGAVADALEAMLAPPVDEGAVRRAANTLQGELYRYLADHLPSQQAMAKFARLLRFLRARARDGRATLDDAALFDFWRQAEPEQDGDLRAYRTAFDVAVQVARALRAAAERQAIARARPLGPDRAAGEVDPALVAGLLDAADGEAASPLRALDSPPADAARFLTGAERDLVALALDGGPLALRLPLSLLRAEVFGRHQGRLTQALRQSGDVAALVRQAPRESYDDRLRRWDGLRRHIARLLAAAAHVLLSSADAEPALAAKLAEGRIAFRRLGRRGFEDAADPATVAACRAAVAPLTAIDRQLAALLERLSGSNAPDFAADTALFAAVFRELYGARL